MTIVKKQAFELKQALFLLSILPFVRSNWIKDNDPLPVKIDSGTLNALGTVTQTLSSEYYWSRSCQDTLPNNSDATQYYWMQFNYDAAKPNDYAFTINAGSTQQLASVYIHVPELIGKLYNHQISGTLYFGMNEDTSANAACATIAGSGYYSCGSTMTGQYLTFVADNAVGLTDNYDSGFFISGISAFSSANLVTGATLTTDRVVRNSLPAFDAYMTQLNPRSTALTPSADPQSCAGYSGSSGAPLIWQLSSPTYIEDLHVVGDGYDGDLVTDENGNNVWDTDQCDADSNAIGPSNKYFYDAKFYVGTTNVIDDATQCTDGDLGADSILTVAADSDGNDDKKMMKLGGTVSCSRDQGPVSFVFLQMPAVDFNVCSVGIFTCSCAASSQVRDESIDHKITIKQSGQAKDTVSWPFPEMDKFENYCHLCQNQILSTTFTPETQNDVRVSDPIVVTTSIDDYDRPVISIEVAWETPVGEYELTIETGFKRFGETAIQATSVVSEKILINVELEKVRFAEEPIKTFGFINGQSEQIYLPYILNGVQNLASVEFTINPPQISDWFIYSVDDWDSSSDAPQAVSSLFYDGDDLTDYTDTNIEIVFTLVDDKDQKSNYSRYIHILPWLAPEFESPLPKQLKFKDGVAVLHELPMIIPVSSDNVKVSMTPPTLETLLNVEWYIYGEDKSVQIDIRYYGDEGLANLAGSANDMAITINVSGQGGGDYKIPVEVEGNDGLPYLKPEPIAVYKYGTLDSMVIDLGYPFDSDGLDAEIDVVFNGGSDDFMYYDSDYYMIFNYDGQDISSGQYTIVVTVTGAINAVEYTLQLHLVEGVLFGDEDPYALDYGDEFVDYDEYGFYDEDGDFYYGDDDYDDDFYDDLYDDEEYDGEVNGEFEDAGDESGIIDEETGHYGRGEYDPDVEVVSILGDIDLTAEGSLENLAIFNDNSPAKLNPQQIGAMYAGLDAVPGLPKGITIPPLRTNQVAILAIPAENLPEKLLFTPVPLVARLTSGVDGVKSLISRQKDIVKETAASGSGDTRPPEARVKKIDNSGKISFGFTVQLDVPEMRFDEPKTDKVERRLQEEAKKSQENLIEVFAVKEIGDEADENKQIMDGWKLLGIGPDGIDLELDFSNPTRISTGEEPDLLLIQLDMSEYKDSSGKSLPSSLVKYTRIPRQMSSKEEADRVGEQGTQASSSAETSIVTNLFINVALAGSLNQIWSLIEGLQVAYHMPLFNVKSPGNVNAFNNYFGKIAAFDIVDTNEPTDQIMYAPEIEAYSVNFQNAGYDDYLVIHNMKSKFYVFVLHLLAYPFIILLYLAARKSTKLNKVKDKASSYFFWNGSFRFLMETYLDICLFSLLNLRFLDWSGDFLLITICNYSAYFLVGVVTIFPIFVLIFYSCKLARWKDADFQNQHGTIFLDLDLNRSEGRWMLILYPLTFMLRRYSLCLVLIFWQEFVWGQVAVMIATSQFMLCFILWYRPFDSKFMTNIEVFNEICNMLTYYVMMAFTDAEPDIDARNVVYGNMFIAIIGLYLAVHVTLMFADICMKIKDGCKKLYTKLCKKKSTADPSKEGEKYEQSQEEEEKEDQLQVIDEQEEEEEEHESKKSQQSDASEQVSEQVQSSSSQPRPSPRATSIIELCDLSDKPKSQLIVNAHQQNLNNDPVFIPQKLSAKRQFSPNSDMFKPQQTNRKMKKGPASLSNLSYGNKHDTDRDDDDDHSLYDVGPAGEIYEGPKIPLKVQQKSQVSKEAAKSQGIDVSIESVSEQNVHSARKIDQVFK